jgi:alanine racemase
MSTDRRTRAWVEVDASALRRNARRLAERVGPSAPLIPMVKADAYGTGVAGAVAALRDEGPAAWGVASVDEGEAVLELGVDEPVHIYSPLPPGELERAVRVGLVPALSDPRELETVGRAARAAGLGNAPFQVEVDTGMGRAGATRGQIEEWRERLERIGEELRWVGLFTHFHSADEEGGPGMEAQFRRFGDAVAQLRPPTEVRVHVGNSAAGVRWGRTRALGAVRAGIHLYGGSAGPDLPPPEPVVAVRARVSRVVEVPAGTTCGYGATYRASRAERWATLSLGYGDGLPRSAVPGAEVVVEGSRVPLVGRVSMDMVVANISGLHGVRLGSVATLLGGDGSERISLDELADRAGTISYEILTGLGRRLPRIWSEVDDGHS